MAVLPIPLLTRAAAYFSRASAAVAAVKNPASWSAAETRGALLAGAPGLAAVAGAGELGAAPPGPDAVV